MINRNIKFGKIIIEPGTQQTIELDIAKLYDFTSVSIPVHVINGLKDGPSVFISAVIHGDEIIGAEIIRRLINKKNLSKISGSLYLIPVVNVFGYNLKSRYLPDRRDLNRSFPGNSKGSLASRLARIFMKEIVSRCDYGIDLHSAAVDRVNAPQVRVSKDEGDSYKLAHAFNAPFIIESKIRAGSLRDAASKKGTPVIVYEAGEALRHGKSDIEIGVNGCLNVLASLGMIKGQNIKSDIVSLKESYWVRSPHSGTFRCFKKLSSFVKEGEEIGHITNLIGEKEVSVFAKEDGYIIGMASTPLVMQGDGIVHIGLSKLGKGRK